VTARGGAFEVSSVLPAPAAAVWARISTMAGVNFELAPFFRMTFPARFAAIDPAAVPIGRRVFRSWILLFGVLPVDYDDLRLERIEPGRGFLETSTMLSQRRWIHERTLEPAGPGCRVTDRVRFEPRLPGLAWLFGPLFHRLFLHRHRRLREAFGGG